MKHRTPFIVTILFGKIISTKNTIDSIDKYAMLPLGNNDHFELKIETQAAEDLIFK